MSESIDALAEEILDSLLGECPDHALELGIVEVNDTPLPPARFPDFSAEGAERRASMIREWMARLKRLPCPQAGTQKALTREVLDHWLTEGFQSRFVGMKGLPHADHIEPLTHLSGVHVAAIHLLTADPLGESSPCDETWLAHIAELPRALRQATAALRERRLRGLVAPRVVLARAISDIRRCVAADAGDVFGQALRDRMQRARSSGERTRLDDVHDCINGCVRPAYGELLEELDRHIACQREDLCAARRPGGEAFYAWRLQACVTKELAPRHAHALGMEELRRLDAEICRELSELGLPVDRFEGFTELTARNAYGTGAEGRREVERDACRWVKEARTAVRPLFNLWPAAEVRVEPIALQDEPSQHSHYLPPSVRRGGAGLFRANLGHLLAVGKAEVPLHCFHETWPGHHLQLALAAESRLCAFRKAVLFPAYLEGWAKYAESLPERVGLATPFMRLARLRMELYSTATLVLDTGIHALGWTRQQARKFFVDETAAPAALADMVILRSAADPGELAAYKIGMLKMQELCAGFEGSSDNRAGLRRFHDAVLRNGALPLRVLDRTVARECATQPSGE